MTFIPSNMQRWSPWNLPGPTLYGYETLDTAATVVGANYFNIEGQDVSQFQFSVGDQINASCADGILILEVTSLNPIVTEASFITIGPNSVNTAAIQDGAVTPIKTTGLAYDDLSNLNAVAINAPLIPDTDNTLDLGTITKRWNDVYATALRAGQTNGQTLTLAAWDVDGAAAVPFFTLTSSNTPSAVLADGVTAFTQLSTDDTDKIATTAFVQDVVGSLPASGANIELSNLDDGAVAINTSLVSDTDATDDLGSITKRWNNIYPVNLSTDHTAGHTMSISAWDVDGGTSSAFITLTANNTPTCVIASGVTGTTQSALDNSTKLATTEYVDSAVAAGGGGLAYVNQNSSSVTMAANTRYGCNNGASLITFTLPAVCAAGDVFEIIGNSSGGWTLAQATGQQIRFGGFTTTTTTGSLSSANRGDCVAMTCIVANTTFAVHSSIGNITYVQVLNGNK